MSKAKYYIYRNLHKDTFSVRYKGKVIAHHDTILAKGVQFRVSEVVRQRVIAEKKKYVHAYVVCDSYEAKDGLGHEPWVSAARPEKNVEVKYNPYKQSSFTVDDKPIKSTSHCLLGNNKVFLGRIAYELFTRHN